MITRPAHHVPQSPDIVASLHQVASSPSRRGSRLAQVLCAFSQPEEITEEAPTFEPLAIYESFSQPRYSAEFLQRKNARLIARDINRAEKSRLRQVARGMTLQMRREQRHVAQNILFAHRNRDRAFGLDRYEGPVNGISVVKPEPQWDVRGGFDYGFDGVGQYVGCARPSCEPDYLSRVESPFRCVTPEDVTPSGSGFAHVVGIRASESAITRVLPVARHLDFCPRCWVARVHQVSIPACLDCRGLAKLDEAEAEHAAKRERTLEEECAAWMKKNNRKLTARGWVGYSSEEFDLDIIEARRGTAEVESITEFDRKMWNASRAKKCKWRIQ